jgi:hypothetical protein
MTGHATSTAVLNRWAGLARYFSAKVSNSDQTRSSGSVYLMNNSDLQRSNAGYAVHGSEIGR